MGFTLPNNTCGGDCIRACLAMFRSGISPESIRRGAKCSACLTTAERMAVQRPDLREILESLGLMRPIGV